MKKSRKVVCWILGVASVFFAGAILGSLVAHPVTYTAIAVGSVALIGFGMWFYKGHETEGEEGEEA